VSDDTIAQEYEEVGDNDEPIFIKKNPRAARATRAAPPPLEQPVPSSLVQVFSSEGQRAGCFALYKAPAVVLAKPSAKTSIVRGRETANCRCSCSVPLANVYKPGGRGMLVRNGHLGATFMTLC
jgi:hypothetical protein